MLSKRRVMKWKIYLDRSKGYIGTIQLLLIGGVFVNTLPGCAGLWIRSHSAIAYPILFVVSLLITFLIGWVDQSMGLREEELKNMFLNDPLHAEMLEILRIHSLKAGKL
jgi:hypothetical protein